MYEITAELKISFCVWKASSFAIALTQLIHALNCTVPPVRGTFSGQEAADSCSLCNCKDGSM